MEDTFPGERQTRKQRVYQMLMISAKEKNKAERNGDCSQKHGGKERP